MSHAPLVKGLNLDVSNIERLTVALIAHAEAIVGEDSENNATKPQVTSALTRKEERLMSEEING